VGAVSSRRFHLVGASLRRVHRFRFRRFCVDVDVMADVVRDFTTSGVKERIGWRLYVNLH
jgi:hypothetical protein